MSGKVAPWLQGLSDDAWVAPPQRSSVSSASHDASSLRDSRSRIPRRSLSGLPSSLSRQTSSTQQSQRRRQPLAPLSTNDGNSLNRTGRHARPAGTRSVSEASNGSLVACGTVQQRSKSASPSKIQETMEWKRRLVHGKLGYGDQTDLFGPSGLENIFSRNSDTENQAPTRKSKMSWLQKSDIPMPSSPPPWPSRSVAELPLEDTAHEEGLSGLLEESELQGRMGSQEQESFLSNPFDLDDSNIQQRDSSQQQPSVCYQSSPDKAFIEPSTEAGAGNRTVSGQTELEQEDFSPVFISKHHTVSGQVGYTAVDSHTIKHFQSTKINLRHPSQRELQDLDSGDEISQVQDRSAFTDGPDSEERPNVPDLSFSENLLTGSPPPQLGDHVELKRGGYSQYGSFKRRPLSPSQSTTAASYHYGQSGFLSPIPSESEHLSQAPTSPRTPGAIHSAGEPKSRSSGSPLKLFAAHDTFTSNRLLRRMSQLNPDGTLRMPVEAEGQQQARITSAGSFGKGLLDAHEFNAEITVTSASDEGQASSEGSPGSEIPVPGSKMPTAFHFDTSPHISGTYSLKRKLSKHSTATSKPSHGSIILSHSGTHRAVEDASESQNHAPESLHQSRSYADGKRPPTSPFKSPTPKRRRTLHASELEDYMSRVNETYHSQLQDAASSRKRKDTKRGDAQIIADPEILAQRKILRPRNPTPSQRRRQQIEAELREAAAEFAEQEPEKLEAVLEQMESSMASESPMTMRQQAEAVATEVAAFTLKVHKPSGEHGERKRSVTTQDFLDEAMMVMNLIRAKARPQSNLGSVEESEGEAMSMSLRADGSHPDDSMLRVSRPPSREHSGWRQRTSGASDVRVISHLRKFQEKDERDDTGFIADSIASLQVDDEQHVNGQVIVLDEESNIRITGPPSDRGRDDTEPDSRPISQTSKESTLDSQKSNGTSTGHTIGTSSTRKSDNVGTLAPEAVAHLIGEQVGLMAYDKEKQCWRRHTRSPGKHEGSFLELPSNVTSDDDPFREISDLRVDEVTETRRISSPGKVVDAAMRQSSRHDQAAASVNQAPSADSRNPSQETVISRPVTRDSSNIHHKHSSSVPSRYTAFASSQQQERVETRATSWSDEELARMSVLGKAKDQPLAYAAAQVELTRRTQRKVDLEEESTIDGPVPGLLHTVHEATASESIEDDSVDHSIDIQGGTVLADTQSDIEDINAPKIRQTPMKHAFPSSAFKNTRQVSLRKQTLTGRFHHDAREVSELSVVAPLPGDRMLSLSLSVSRPVNKRFQHHQLDELQSTPSKRGSSHILSDLPDFTIHEDDSERPSERALAQRLAHHAAAEVNDRYALAVKELVKSLTDVNADEPFWEDVKQLDLHARSLVSLQGLQDFCSRIQDMDVANNGLTHLHGAPFTLRKLNVRSNQLTCLTSWAHLSNLQYLDISHNQLENLDGLASLVHLRELRADDNHISTLDGLLGLDGLLKLRLRRNKLKNVDLSSSDLRQLSTLDLSENQISAISDLDTLVSLKELKLDRNSFPQGLSITKPMPNITSLSIQHCGMNRLDVSSFPNLMYLLADGNRLSNIHGLGRLSSLQLLSMRAQELPDTVAVSIFEQPFDTRMLRLSGNRMPVLRMARSFLTIQHLEMASVGLQELPDDFGLRMPNLRSLNLNFNNLKDVRPLLNIQRLEELSICGNRLYQLRKSVATFAKMPGLRKLNLRDNLLTQNFYPSLASTMSRNTSLVPATRLDEDEDEVTAILASTQYEYPATDLGLDKQHIDRLDEDTKLRRRVHQMLLVSSCRDLEELDGLLLDKNSVVAKDDVMERLRELGVVKKSRTDLDRRSGLGTVFPV